MTTRPCVCVYICLLIFNANLIAQQSPDAAQQMRDLMRSREECRRQLAENNVSLMQKRLLYYQLFDLDRKLNDQKSHQSDLESFSEFAEGLQDRESVTWAASQLAEIYLDQGNKPKATKYAQIALGDRNAVVRSTAYLVLAQATDDPKLRAQHLRTTIQFCNRILTMPAVAINHRYKAALHLGAAHRLQSSASYKLVAESLLRAGQLKVLSERDLTAFVDDIVAESLTAGNRPFAVGLLRHIVQQAPEDSQLSALHNLVKLHIEYGENDAATELLESFTKGAQPTSENSIAFEMLAQMYTRQERYESARAIYFQLLQLAQDTKDEQKIAVARVHFGATEYAVGNAEAARSEFQTALETLAGSKSVNEAIAHNGLGEVAASQGRLRDAVSHFNQATELLRSMEGAQYSGYLAVVLHNLAQVYITQHLYDRASKCILESKQLKERLLGTGSIHLAEELLALADIAESSGDFQTAADCIQQAWDLCKRHDGQISFKAQTLDRYGRLKFFLQDIDEAKKAWTESLKTYAEIEDPAGQVKTLNLLAQAALKQNEVREAQTLLKQADAIHAQQLDGHLLLKFSTLANLAVAAQTLGQQDEAIELMIQAADLSERPREMSFGGSREKAITFNTFAPAYYYLLDWMIARHSDDKNKWTTDSVLEVLTLAERFRNRSYLDDLQSRHHRSEKETGVVRSLRERQQNLLKEVASLRAAARNCRDEIQLLDLRQQFVTLQELYHNVTTEIENAHQSGFESEAARPPRLKDEELQHFTQGKHALLYYILTLHNSYLIAVGPGKDQLSFTELKAPAKFSSAPAMQLAQKAFDTRGPVGIVEMVPHRTAQPGEWTQGDFGRAQVDAIVRRYLAAMSPSAADPRAPRKLVLFAETAQQSAQPQPHLLGDVFVPPNVREQIAEADSVMVIRDGSLYSLPLEGLPVAGESEERYLLDELPPVQYAPSLKTLAAIRDRHKEVARPTVVTVGDVPYRTVPEVQKIADYPELDLLTSHRLSPLPASAEESEAVRRAFGTSHVIMLSGKEATEKNVLQAMADANIVHFAAHGVVHQEYDNQFGALVLAPPTSEGNSADNDGYLSVYEIGDIDLRRCQLGILSACQTNVGADRPLEAPSSLSRAFFTAGAARVLSSSWQVHDKSTSMLVASFCEELAQSDAQGSTDQYGRALKFAKQKVREQYPHPSHWASFTLSGPLSE